jgi:ABC-2 type transport system ATP-binding protein
LIGSLAPPAPQPPLLDVRGLGKRFGAKVAIRDIGLTLGAGQVLGFVGPNGAGKTTTLRVLAGLLRADTGEGEVLGHDIMTAHGLVSECVGYMPQRLALYGELTVAQNLRFRADVYGLDDARGAVEAAVQDFELTPYRNQRASNLSGGWARKLLLAAALIHKPRLVLLDEPTAGLDADSKMDVWRRIVALARGGVSVVINTHDLIEAEQCTGIALFSQGRILARGDPTSLTKAAPFEAVLISGHDVHDVAGRFGALDCVMAAHPQGQHLRLLYHPGAMDEIRRVAATAGVAVEATHKRLEDAAFVTVHQSAIIISDGAI